MKYLYALIVGLVFTGLIAPYYTHSLAQQPEDFDHGRYREVKDAVQTVLVYVAKKYGGETYDEGKLKGFASDTAKLLASVKKEYPEMDYSIIGDQIINAPEQMAKGFMFVTTLIQYKDEKSSIQWEFNTVFGINEVNFYSVRLDGTPKSFDDYYHWNEMRKIPQDTPKKSEQGL
jgi:hypothetical protein